MTEFDEGRGAMTLGSLAEAVTGASERALERKTRQRVEVDALIPQDFGRPSGRGEYRFWVIMDAE